MEKISKMVEARLIADKTAAGRAVFNFLQGPASIWASTLSFEVLQKVAQADFTDFIGKVEKKFAGELYIISVVDLLCYYSTKVSRGAFWGGHRRLYSNTTASVHNKSHFSSN